MATSEQNGPRAVLTAEISAVLIRYRRRISDRGGVVPDACLDELVAVAERPAGRPAGRPEPYETPSRGRGVTVVSAEVETVTQRPTAPATPVPGPGRRQARRRDDTSIEQVM